MQALLETVPAREDADGPRAGPRGSSRRSPNASPRRTSPWNRTCWPSVREALPADSPSFWDMTILAYWAWSAFDAEAPQPPCTPRRAPAASATASRRRSARRRPTPTRPVLAVSGDGGALYSIAELATARQYDLNVTWLIVDDGGYGILREYMTDAFGEATATELSRPDFVALAESFGVPGVRTTPETLAADLAKALASPGPSVVVLPALLRMFAPTHLGSD